MPSTRHSIVSRTPPFSYDAKKWREFLDKLNKVRDLFHAEKLHVRFLNGAECQDYVDRYFAMNFRDAHYSMTNFKVDGEDILMGDRHCRVFSLVDVDNINLPTIIRPYTLMTVNNSEMPVDLLAGIDSIPGIESAVYNQVIFMPNQKHELAMLDKKKNRHSSIPSPSNALAVEVFIKRGNNGMIIGVEEPHECYMAYTTEKIEKEGLMLYHDQLHCDFEEAIRRYCEDWDRSGIRKPIEFAQKVKAAGRVLNLPPVISTIDYLIEQCMNAATS